MFYNSSTGEGYDVVFHHPDYFQNLIIDKGGYYKLIRLTDTEAEYEFDIQYNDDNYLKGTFVTANCQ